jgi:hypothetical protein
MQNIVDGARLVKPSVLANDEPQKLPKPKTALFVCLPNQILKHPPIAHRNSADTGLLPVFDCAVVAGIVALTQGQVTQQRHDYALGVGKQALRQQRKKVDKDSKWMAQYRVRGVNYEFHLAGSGGYFEGEQDFDRGAGRTAVSLEITRSKLLRAANLSNGGKNHARLDAALKRLRSPVRGVGSRREFPPLLLAVKRLPDGRVRLSVNSKWLPRELYGRVPMPVPTRGNCANALALFLFLCGTDQRQNSRTASMETEKLCLRIGISYRYPKEASDALDDALATVNTHLKKLNRLGALEAATKPLPLRFDLLPLNDDDRVSFQAHCGARQGEEMEMAATDDSDEPDRQPSDRCVERYDEEMRERRIAEPYDRKMRERSEWAAFNARLAKI